MKLQAIFVALIICSAPAVALARDSGPTHKYEAALNSSGSDKLLDAASLATAKTFNLKSGSAAGYAYLALYVFFDHAANGTLTITATATKDGQDYDLTTCSVSAGACTLSFAGSWTTPSLSADKRFMVPIGIMGASDVEVTITHNGTPTDDAVSVKGDLVTQ